MRHSSEVRFAVDHPTAAGHFPSNPIIPGVLLLDEVVRAVTAPGRDTRTLTFRTAKFFRPVRPGQAIRILWDARENGRIEFECRLIEGDVLAAAGTVAIEPAPP